MAEMPGISSQQKLDVFLILVGGKVGKRFFDLLFFLHGNLITVLFIHLYVFSEHRKLFLLAGRFLKRSCKNVVFLGLVLLRIE